MINTISKADWKLFQERLPGWQENYMGRLLEEYIDLLKGSGNPSDRFWKLEKRIKDDKKDPGVQMSLDKGEAVWDIACLVNRNVISMDDLKGFSVELIESVNTLIDRWRSEVE